jgi:DNA-binding NarL/FixJ family response regulator
MNVPTKEAMCESAAQICARYRNGGTPPKILVVSRNDSDDAIIDAVRAGIVGYLSHVQVPEELHNAVQIVGKGGAIFSPTIAVRLSQFFSTGDNHSRSSSFYDLTARELQIVDLLASGMRNGEIARRLYLTEKTVRNYVSRIFVKLDVHDRAGAALRARGAGFGLLTEGGPSMATKAGGGALHRQPPGSRAPGHARESGRSGRATAVRDHGDDAGG